jgi:hypothetical protein
MPAPKSTMTPSDFDALVRRSGLPLSEEQSSDLYAAHGYVEALAERVRARERPREGEPALIFKPVGR